ncbi:MAG TPA: hypothetical protein VI386_25840 [Candidatus Sulfotelmatobacter sp.]
MSTPAQDLQTVENDWIFALEKDFPQVANLIQQSAPADGHWTRPQLSNLLEFLAASEQCLENSYRSSALYLCAHGRAELQTRLSRYIGDIHALLTRLRYLLATSHETQRTNDDAGRVVTEEARLILTRTQRSQAA